MNPLELQTKQEVTQSPIIPDVRDQINKYLKKEERTPSWLARKLGISHTTVSKFLRGDGNIEKYVKLINAELGTSFGKSEVEKTSQVNN